jgi:hypothetical protein
MNTRELVFFVTLIVSLQFAVNSFGFDLGGALESLGEIINNKGKDLKKGLQEKDENQSCEEGLDGVGNSKTICEQKLKQKIVEEPQQQIQSQRENNNKQTKRLVSSNQKQNTSTVRLTAVIGNTGWMVRVEIPGDSLEVFYKLPNNLDYKSMGLSNYTNTNTGFLMPNQHFNLPCSIDEHGVGGYKCEDVKMDIKIKYIDITNNEKGPFTIFFDGEEMTEKFCNSMKLQVGEEMISHYPGCENTYDYRQK